MWMRVISTLAIVLVLAFWLNSSYGKISEKGYQFAMALISICNREDEKRLEKISQQIGVAVRDGELGEYDARVLLDITDRAEAGRWQQASNAIRRLMEAQVDQ